MSRKRRWSIRAKLAAGYLPLSFLIIGMSAFILFSLYGMNEDLRSIIERDMILVREAEAMTDNLISQQSYAQRYSILKSPEMLDLFRQRKERFEGSMALIRGISDREIVPAEAIGSLHERFSRLYAAAWEEIPEKEGEIGPVDPERARKIETVLADLTDLIRKMAREAKLRQRSHMLGIHNSGVRTFHITVALSVLGLLFGLGAAYWISRGISLATGDLMRGAERISQGEFDYTPNIRGDDELRDLGEAFADMAGRLARLEEIYRDASPLTGVPGGRAVERELEARVEEGRDVAFCLLDLDDFKPYNDHYGYAKGNEVIKMTAEVLADAVRAHGNEDDFIGHIGGDDFALITMPDCFEPICERIVTEFDRRIPGFYSEADRERGGIVGKTRQGSSMKFSMISISIAVTLKEKDDPPISSIRLGELAAEVKEYAKSKPGSLYVVDRRGREEMTKRTKRTQGTET